MILNFFLKSKHMPQYCVYARVLPCKVAIYDCNICQIKIIVFSEL